MRDPLTLYKSLGPLRLDGVGSLECARSIATGQRVCLRKVPDSPRAQEAIAAALALGRHRSIAPALESDVWRDEAWLATDFPEGTLLEGEERVWPAHALAADFAPVAQALALLHGCGQVHGLLAGDAVLLEPGGTLVLHGATLVELNRVTDRRPEQTALAQLQSTATYFSPARLKGGLPTAADDVYGLGVLLSVLGGAPRPAGSSALERLHTLMVGAWRPQPPAGFPEPLKRLLEQMTAVEPERRPSAREVASQLEALDRPSWPAQSVTVSGELPAPVPTAPGAPAFASPERLPELPAAPILAVLQSVDATVTDPHSSVTMDPDGADPLFIAARVRPRAEVVMGGAAAPTATPMMFAPAPTQELAVVPGPAPTAPYGSISGGALLAPPPPAPTIPSPGPRFGGAASASPAAVPITEPTPPVDAFRLRWPLLSSVGRGVTGFTVSIASSDAKLITTSLLALSMLASTVALGAHVFTQRAEAAELAAAELIKPRAPKEPKYNAEQLKQILRQKEAAHREY